MDRQALVEMQVGLFEDVCEQMKKIRGKAAASDEVIAVFNTVHSWQMNAAIKQQQDERSTTREAKPKSDVKCKECGNLLTVGEKKYCDDADKAYRCYKCTKG